MKLIPTHLEAWNSAEVYGVWVRPFADGHALANPPAERWGWTRSSARRCLDDAWRMTGVWQARRPYVLDRDTFDETVAVEVERVARVLDDAGVTSLRDLASLSQTDWERSKRVQRKVFNSVLLVSRLKPTKVPVPMFGSKVLHHYFPTLVPVYDDQWVKKAAMTTPRWLAFEADHDDWIIDPEPVGRDDKEMVRFRRWFGGCLAGISQLSGLVLTRLRADVQRSLKLQRHPSWIPSRLDAKIAEWCLVGEAHATGYLLPRSMR